MPHHVRFLLGLRDLVCTELLSPSEWPADKSFVPATQAAPLEKPASVL
jgi:hypothetical protein